MAMTAAARPSMAAKTGRLAVGGEGVGRRRRARTTSTPAASRKPGRPTRTRAAADAWPTTPPPGDRAGSRSRRRAARPRVSVASRTIASASGCSEPRSAAATRASSSSSSGAPSARTMSVTRGLPSVSVPVLSSTTALHRAEPLERLGVAEQDAVLGALAGPDHDRGRRREAERAGAGDDQDRDRVEQGEVERRLRAEGEPDDERERGEAEHGRARSSRSRRRPGAGSGAREPWASDTSRMIRASTVSRADAGRPEGEGARSC